MKMADVENVLLQDATLPPDVAKAKAEAIMGLLPTSQRTISALWLLLVGGLVIALLVSVAGVLVAVLDGKPATSPDVLITMFTTTSAGLLGLFVKSPTAPEANS